MKKPRVSLEALSQNFPPSVLKATPKKRKRIELLGAMLWRRSLEGDSTALKLLWTGLPPAPYESSAQTVTAPYGPNGNALAAGKEESCLSD